MGNLVVKDNNLLKLSMTV